jgi:PilZ domain
LLKLYAAPFVPGGRRNSEPRERRRAVRYAFGGVAEVTHLESGNYLLSIVTELSRNACFIRTDHPFPADSNVDLRITHNRVVLRVAGKVILTRPNRGMAIAFESVSPMEQVILDSWLTEAAGQAPR